MATEKDSLLAFFDKLLEGVHGQGEAGSPFIIEASTLAHDLLVLMHISVMCERQAEVFSVHPKESFLDEKSYEVGFETSFYFKCINYFDSITKKSLPILKI